MLNPFIELARNPIAAFAWLGYLLVMTGIITAAIPWTVRQAATLIVQYRKNRHSDAWWSFGNTSAGYIPPLGWLTRLFSVLFVLAIVAWSLGTIVWLIGGGA